VDLADEDEDVVEVDSEVEAAVVASVAATAAVSNAANQAISHVSAPRMAVAATIEEVEEAKDTITGKALISVAVATGTTAAAVEGSVVVAEVEASVVAAVAEAALSAGSQRRSGSTTTRPTHCCRSSTR